jgi:hypothetical protein
MPRLTAPIITIIIIIPPQHPGTYELISSLKSPWPGLHPLPAKAVKVRLRKETPKKQP